MEDAGRKKILIVDDEPDLHVVLKTRLEVEGYEVFSALTGKEALALFPQVKPDLMIIDVIMPEMNGFEVCKKIKAIDPDVKTIIYTSKIDGVDAGRAQAAGADLFTVKTSSSVLLLASIKRVLG